MEWDTLYIEKKEAVAFLTLDRSASLNAVNDQLTADLEAACQTLDADTDLQVVVLRGEGPRLLFRHGPQGGRHAALNERGH